MEKMPKLVWEKETIFCTGDVYYYSRLKGIDASNREYFYTAKITKVTNYIVKKETIYKAEYKCFEDGNNFRLKPIYDSKEFKTLEDAKTFIKNAFQKMWNNTHA